MEDLIMKTIILSLTIILGTMFTAPVVKADANKIAGYEKVAGNPFVNQKSARRFHTNRGYHRRSHTCLRKNGCKKIKVGKMFKHKSNCHEF